jgi:formylglycine-generating enzyme required for sulfatase activity/predicted Ser/Thr protein kinase
MIPREVMNDLLSGKSESELRERHPQFADRIAEWVRQHEVVRQGFRLAERRFGGLRIPGYVLITEIARGGQGVVYRACREGETEAKFAIKVLRPASEPSQQSEHVARLHREAEVLRSVSHPRIVRVHEVGTTEGGQAFLVMDYIDGSPLTPENSQGLEPPHRVALIGAVARTVGAAHARGVVHRDLKPSNILIAADGAPFVLDFGMASMLNAEELRQTLTTTGQFVGTYLWASPEQLRGEADLSPASDVYSLGVLLHQLATGRFPPQVFSSLKTLIEPGFSVDSSNLAVLSLSDRRLEGLIRRCLETDPKRRFADGDALAEAAESYLRGEGAERVAAVSRRKVLVAGALALTATAAGAVGGWKWWRRARREAVPSRPRLFQGRELIEIPGETSPLVYIPPGMGVIGSPITEPFHLPDQRLQEVRFERGFYLAMHEVRQSLYERVMGVNPSRFIGENLPVERVSWYDAMEFCRRLSEREGMPFRLPTEVEWEYACRGGTRTTYWFGDDAKMMLRYGNVADQSNTDSAMLNREAWNDDFPNTAIVGNFLANPYSLWDLHGNVWEWTSSQYAIDPMDPSTRVTGDVRYVCKGGSWWDTIESHMSANRNPLKPETKTSTLGFRIALDDPSPLPPGVTTAPVRVG